ncbi:MAG: thiamine phosphate synthase [Bacteroidales bacterium]|jgi:thiamine-phosphate pyrophosphorylase|nr:thiamine phosphate synthase [Bacteroidales bacterium]
MQLVIITHDTLFAGEADILNRLFDAGMECLHLRKPAFPASVSRQLLQQIDKAYHSRVVLHDHFELLREFPVRGVHLNSRNPVCPPDVEAVSRSCHSIACLRTQQRISGMTLFLSPIFDSISKKGYTATFTHEELLLAGQNGLINRKVMALGGISEATIPRIAAYGFGGVAVLGALWNDRPSAGDSDAVIRRFAQLQSMTGT